MKAPILAIALVGAVLTFAACSADSSGQLCSSDNFDSQDCLDRIAASDCQDGGVVTGTTSTCCVWSHCAERPFPR